MRTRLAALAAAGAVALAGGCGGGDDKAGTPLDEALGYLPRDAAAVVVLETDPQHAQWKQVNELISRFAIAGQIRQQGKDRIARGPLDFDRDLRPQLGNELVAGKPDTGGKRELVLAVKLQDPERARRDLLPDLGRVGLQARIDGEMLVAASTRELLDDAVRQHDADDRLTEDDLEDDLGRLAEGDPLLRATGNLQKALESDRAGAATRAVPWLGALRRFAAAGKTTPNGLSVDFDVTTAAVDEAQLPFAPGAAAPPVPVREGEIAVAAREPGRTLSLVDRLKDVLPRTKAHAAALNDALKRIGVDVQRDLIGQLGDVGAVSFPLDSTYVARAELKDPARFAGTLKKLADELPAAARGDIGFTIEPGGGEGFYRLNADRGRQLFVGVVDDQVALGEEAGRARDFAAERSAPVPGARGSVALSADAESVAAELIERRASGPLALLGQVLTDPLGDLRGWMEARPTGLTGHAELE
nr:DUF3352 domain-containing protein [Actinomycetota bacterium]